MKSEAKAAAHETKGASRPEPTRPRSEAQGSWQGLGNSARQRELLKSRQEMSESRGMSEDALSPSSSSCKPLDEDSRRDFESRFGHDFSSVRIHDDAAAGALAIAHGARALTLGNRITFAPGFYQPQTSEGRRLLAHELAHVIQQSVPQAGVLPGLLAADHPAEKEASRAAERLGSGFRMSRSMPRQMAREAFTTQEKILKILIENDPKTYPERLERLRELIKKAPEVEIPILEKRLQSKKDTLGLLFQKLPEADQQELLSHLTKKPAVAAAASEQPKNLTPAAPQTSDPTGLDKLATSQEKILKVLLRPVAAGDEAALAVKYQDLRQLFRNAKKDEVAILQKRLSAKDPSKDPLAIHFQKLPLATQGELLSLLSKGPTVAQSENPPASPNASQTSDRVTRQSAQLAIIQNLRDEAVKAFRFIDSQLPLTSVYDAFLKVRKNVLDDIGNALDQAERLLGSSDPAAEAEKTRVLLEKAQLWLFYVVPYAHLAALSRSAQHDRLVLSVQAHTMLEAAKYEQAFSAIQLGTPAALTAARTKGSTILGETRDFLNVMEGAIKKGKESVEVAEGIEEALNIPLEFGSGAVLPPQALIFITLYDRGGFYRAHQWGFEILEEIGPTAYREMAWIEANAPLTKKLILLPIFKGMLHDSYKGIPKDIPFILGRILYLLKQKKSPVTVTMVAGAAMKAFVIVNLLHSPKLLIAGLASVTTRTRESVIGAFGGEVATQVVVDEINQTLGTSLSSGEVLDLLLELTTPPVVDHLKALSEAISTMAPEIAAIVADMQGKGMASEATLKASSFNVPLLPPVP